MNSWQGWQYDDRTIADGAEVDVAAIRQLLDHHDDMLSGMDGFEKSVLPAGLTCQSDGGAWQKANKFAETGPDKIHVVFDFDRTLTVKRAGVNGDITTWNIMKQHLPEDGQRRYMEFFHHFRKLELDGLMTTKHAVEWWSGILELFVEYKVDLSSVEREFVANASIREGSKELFELCERLGVPVVILSAGIKEVIEIWARKFDVHPSVVLATALKTNENSIVTGWNRKSLVHVFNKKELDHVELTRIREERPLAILVGDSIDDADMASGTEDVFRIRIYDPRPDEQRPIEQVRELTFQRFDAMIESGGFAPIVEFMGRIAG